MLGLLGWHKEGQETKQSCRQPLAPTLPLPRQVQEYPSKPSFFILGRIVLWLGIISGLKQDDALLFRNLSPFFLSFPPFSISSVMIPSLGPIKSTPRVLFACISFPKSKTRWGYEAANQGPGTPRKKKNTKKPSPQCCFCCSPKSALFFRLCFHTGEMI